MKMKKNRREKVVIVPETELIPDTDLRSPSAVERNKWSWAHLPLVGVVNRLGYHLIIG
jgi:hypothetical protein